MRSSNKQDILPNDDRATNLQLPKDGVGMEIQTNSCEANLCLSGPDIGQSSNQSTNFRSSLFTPSSSGDESSYPQESLPSVNVSQNCYYGKDTKSSLKLDVNMGFTGDLKNEASPTTLLEPVFGWKKRRSVSDVGPRTPSLLGPAVETIPSPIDDLSYLINTMEGRAHLQSTRNSLQNSRPLNENSLNFESLHIRVDDEFGTTQQPIQNYLSDDVPIVAVDDSINFVPLTTDVHEQTLNPASFASTPEPNIGRSPGKPYGHENLRSNISFDKSNVDMLAGPVRRTASCRSMRGGNPYPTSTQNVTAKTEFNAQESVAYKDAIRMMNWRFPSNQQNSLHPLDAYSRPMKSTSALHNRGVRHTRGSVSDDFRSDWQMHNTNASYTMDWTPISVPFDRSWNMERCRSMPATALAGAKRTEQHQVSVTPPNRVPQSDSLRINKTLHKQTDAIYKPERRSLSDSGTSLVESILPSSAAQTATPVVTTSAAQAASASRRKNDALYTCPFPDCGSTFTRQYNLRGHMRSHMDERPYKCDWPGCGRSFARTHDCKRHQNLHLNIRPYHCESCGKTFARLDALNRHFKTEANTCGAQVVQRNS